MRIDYPDGSFMLAWQHARAWYDNTGKLKDAEYKRGRKTVAVAMAHTKVRAWLAKQGQQEAGLLNSGRLKRKP